MPEVLEIVREVSELGMEVCVTLGEIGPEEACKLKAAGVRIITISVFSERMLRANAEHAGIADLFDDLLSTEVNQTYKPDPRAYALGMERLHLNKDEIAFAAFGAWDAYGAKSFGYPTFWVNRFSVPAEELGVKADGTSNNFQGLLDFVLGKPGG